ncbi:MAG TPA: serine/threonine-protein kinase, partial [Tepidisphaeraceae bacterium]|nr:serine/threonine-protein kinase [Tepidisphaeraceae bacterium]
MIEPTRAANVHSDEDLLAALTDDFLRRHRAGEHPSVDEYARKHPKVADQIRDLFPAMMAMEHPGFAPTLDPAPPAERVGAIIGRYKLLERIGEGGFGIVYMAEQQHPVRRKVALKVIKPGLDTRQVIARFEAERQALALMDHENIAKVLDAGATDSGRPYFVMELVHGVPITDFCDKNQLPPRERLELFVQVCRAVQHAHTKGIIHRDIKPTNVLVTLHEGVAVPKVIDFGVAKATGQQLTDKTLFTNFAQMVGTPLYMSPEQAEMTSIDVDTRSDVYSLGVLLYELLTGTTPLDKDRLKQAAFDEVRRIIREEEPPRPSTRLSTMGEQGRSISAHRKSDPKHLGRLVRGELDWIVMKALEKDRSRRYETANGLARDVERHLQDEPVQACPPSATYRLRKIARRHRVTLGVAAGFVSLLVAATLVSSALAVRARRAESLAQARLETETQARARAVTEAAKATTISDLLLEMFSSTNPDQSKGADYTVRQLLDEAAPRMRDQLKGQPEVEAAISAAIGTVYRRLGLHEKA